MVTLLAVKGLNKTTPEFRAALVAMAARLGVDPNFITSVMASETGFTFSPQARNPTTSATGLIQFMPRTAIGLGTTIQALFAMTAVEQLKYVEKYYHPFAGIIASPGDAYMAVFMPNNPKNPKQSFIGADPSTVIATNPDPIYTENKIFDHTSKGYITVGDVETRAESIYTAALAVPPIVDPDVPVDDGGGNVPPIPPLVTAGLVSTGGGFWTWAGMAVLTFFGVRWLWPPKKK